MIPSDQTIGVFESCKSVSLSRPDILWATYYQTRQLLDQDIPGDFVECGVFTGTHPAMMARAIIDHGCERTVHLFDGFDGIPEPTPMDCEQVNSHYEVLHRDTACSLKDTKAYMHGWNIPDRLLTYHDGRFADTMPLFHEPIALLRIDCDLYESVKTVLQFLWPNVVRCGVCVLDDYQWVGCRTAFQEFVEPGEISPIAWSRR